MWDVNGLSLSMAEGDYGIALPIRIRGASFSEGDSVSMSIKTAKNGQTKLTVTFSNITGDTFDLQLTSAQSAELPVGSYVYSLDWFNNGEFLCNIVPIAVFKVVDKA